MNIIYEGQVSLIEKVWPENEVMAGVKVKVVDMGKAMRLDFAAQEILDAGYVFTSVDILSQFIQKLEPENFRLLPLATLTPECQGPYVKVYLIGEICGSLYYAELWMNGLPQGTKLLVAKGRKYSAK